MARDPRERATLMVLERVGRIAVRATDHAVEAGMATRSAGVFGLEPVSRAARDGTRVLIVGAIKVSVTRRVKASIGSGSRSCSGCARQGSRNAAQNAPPPLPITIAVLAAGRSLRSPNAGGTAAS